MIDYGLEAQLKLLSDEWLKRKQGRQMTFDLGSFDLPKMWKEGAAAVFTREGKLEAFATWLPYQQGKGRCLDLMRSYPEAKGVLAMVALVRVHLPEGLVRTLWS